MVKSFFHVSRINGTMWTKKTPERSTKTLRTSQSSSPLIHVAAAIFLLGTILSFSSTTTTTAYPINNYEVEGEDAPIALSTTIPFPDNVVLMMAPSSDTVPSMTASSTSNTLSTEPSPTTTQTTPSTELPTKLPTTSLSTTETSTNIMPWSLAPFADITTSTMETSTNTMPSAPTMPSTTPLSTDPPTMPPSTEQPTILSTEQSTKLPTTSLSTTETPSNTKSLSTVPTPSTTEISTNTTPLTMAPFTNITTSTMETSTNTTPTVATMPPTEPPTTPPSTELPTEQPTKLPITPLSTTSTMETSTNTTLTAATTPPTTLPPTEPPTMPPSVPTKPSTERPTKQPIITTTPLSTTDTSTNITSSPTTLPPKNYTAIIIGVVVIIIFLIILVVGIVLFRKRKAEPKLPGLRIPPPHIEVVPLMPFTSPVRPSRPPPPRPLPPKPTSIPVDLNRFLAYVEEGQRDSNMKFAAQYEDLKMVGKDQSVEHAVMEENRPKNRFTNILPYDHSRVKLPPIDCDEASDYINANYMLGYNSPREFIVTQGPLASTVADFWRMAWDQKVQAIVMVTKCREKRRDKCFQYWPLETQTPLVLGDLEITTLSYQESQDWRTSQLNIDSGDLENRKLTHYNYTSWPDFGVPKEPASLVAFVRMVRSKCRSGPNAGPILVHCSAGVGRSGTFICLDWSLQYIIEHSSLDIFGNVHKMRKNRTFMVQTESQYVFLHACVSHVLQEEAEAEAEHLYANVNQAFEPDEGICDSRF